MGIKGSGREMPHKARFDAARDSYEKLVVPGWLRWLVEEAQHDLHPAITKKLLGSTTLTAAAKRAAKKSFVYQDGSLIRRKHEDAVRVIRNHMNSAVQKHLKAHGGNSASGNNVADIIAIANEVAWREMTSKTAKASKETIQSGGDENVDDSKMDVGDDGFDAPRTKDQQVTSKVMPQDYLSPFLLVFTLFGCVAGKYADDDFAMGLTKGGVSASGGAFEQEESVDGGTVDTTSDRGAKPSAGLKRENIGMLAGVAPKMSRRKLQNLQRQVKKSSQAGDQSFSLLKSVGRNEIIMKDTRAKLSQMNRSMERLVRVEEFNALTADIREQLKYARDDGDNELEEKLKVELEYIRAQFRAAIKKPPLNDPQRAHEFEAAETEKRSSPQEGAPPLSSTPGLASITPSPAISPPVSMTCEPLHGSGTVTVKAGPPSPGEAYRPVARTRSAQRSHGPMIDLYSPDIYLVDRVPLRPDIHTSNRATEEGGRGSREAVITVDSQTPSLQSQSVPAAPPSRGNAYGRLQPSAIGLPSRLADMRTLCDMNNPFHRVYVNGRRPSSEVSHPSPQISTSRFFRVSRRSWSSGAAIGDGDYSQD